MKRVAAKFVLHLLTEGQNNKCVNVCCFAGRAQNNPHSLTKVITGDESWCYSYDPESKQQSGQWKSPDSPRPKTVLQVHSSIKTMLISFFDVDGILHREFVPPGQTINQQFYLNVVKSLHERLWRKCPEEWQSGDWFLHRDNAPAHTALSVQQFLAKNKMVAGGSVPPLTPTPYSPDLTPCYFVLYPRVKQNLKGKHFVDVAEVQWESPVALDSISIEVFRQCFQQWEQHWHRCVPSKGLKFQICMNISNKFFLTIPEILAMIVNY